MARLTNEQLLFLKSQNVPISMLFDASGISASERRREMDALGKYFYYGGAPCKSAGHTLRTKSGHCIQCDTSKIAYQLRSTAAGYVYLAYSQSSGCVKIGYTKFHPQERGAFLRNEAYGGIADWDVKNIRYFDKDAGRFEFKLHAALERYQKPIFYEKYRGVYVECREIFAIDLPNAIEFLNSIQ